jgi:hypothetical protein
MNAGRIARLIMSWVFIGLLCGKAVAQQSAPSGDSADSTGPATVVAVPAVFALIWFLRRRRRQKLEKLWAENVALVGGTFRKSLEGEIVSGSYQGRRILVSLQTHSEGRPTYHLDVITSAGSENWSLEPGENNPPQWRISTPPTELAKSLEKEGLLNLARTSQIHGDIHYVKSGFVELSYPASNLHCPSTATFRQELALLNRVADIHERAAAIPTVQP